MVHNGIEYGMMAAYAEGLGILHGANIGKQQGEANAETTPLRDPELYQFDLNLADISEVWRRGSGDRLVLLDLTADALVKDSRSPDLPDASRILAKDGGRSRRPLMKACPRRY